MKRHFFKIPAKGDLKDGGFSAFLEDPPIAMALLAFGLIALVLAILEFSQTVGY